MSIGGLHPSEKMRGSASGLEKTTRRTLLSADGCAAATLVIAGLGLGRSYIRSQPVLATACAILAAISFIVLVRRLWVRLLGPVLFYELVRLARRNRYFLIRALYLGIIGALLYWQYRDTVLYTRIYTVFPKASVSINQAAVFSEQFC